VSDAGFWTGFGLDYDVTKKISMEYESQVRFDQNVSHLSQYYNEISGGYKIIKGLQTSLTYRYARKNNGDYYFNQNRFCFNLSYKYKVGGGITLSTRARYQHSFDRLSVVNDIYPNKKNIYRMAFKISYKHKDFKRVQPYFKYEFFNAIQPVNKYSSLDTYRLKIGANLDLPGKHTVKLFYMFEHENRSVDNQNHIYGIQYNYSLKFKGTDKSVD
jgi:hypothetical protein